MRDLSSILIKEAASTVHLFQKRFIMIGSPLYNFCKTEVESSFASEQKTFDDLFAPAGFLAPEGQKPEEAP